MTSVEGLDQLVAILPSFLLRCGVAVVCGAIVGIERELKHKPAGLRTNILICLGSAIYMMIGLLVPDRNVDVTRIGAQVVTGIGFLGAGCIIQAGARVTGLTSAATIWVVASIGLVVGAGFPVLALLSSFVVLLTLAVLAPIEARFLDRSLHDSKGDDVDAGR